VRGVGGGGTFSSSSSEDGVLARMGCVRVLLWF